MEIPRAELSWAAPALSGLLVALSLPPLPTSPLPFVALVPLAVHVARLPSGRAGARGALVAGLWTGWVLFALALHWIAFSIPGRPLVGAGLYVAVVGILAFFPALAAWATHRALHSGVPLWAALPLAWTAAEWLRGALPLGLAFPWGGVALGLAGWPAALAPASWGGELALALWIGVVNGGAVHSWMAWRGRGADAPPDDPAPMGGPARAALAWLAVAAAAFLAPFVAGALLTPWTGAAGASVGDPLRIAVLRTDVSAETRRDAGAGADSMAAAVERLLSPLEPGSVDLVVLPETAFPVPLEHPAEARRLDLLRAHAARLGAPLLVGGYGMSDGLPAGVYHNSVFVVDASGIRGRYDKRRLVPGVERPPPGAAALLSAAGDSAWYAAGALTEPLEVAGVTVGVLVCYESAFAALARGHVREGATLLINPTNDAWFGGGVPGRVARAQHTAHLALRAVETGVPIVRAANGGPAMVVDASGSVLARSDGEVEGVVMAELFAGPAHRLARGRRGLRRPPRFLTPGSRVSDSQVRAPGHASSGITIRGDTVWAITEGDFALAREALRAARPAVRASSVTGPARRAAPRPASP